MDQAEDSAEDAAMRGAAQKTEPTEPANPLELSELAALEQAEDINVDQMPAGPHSHDVTAGPRHNLPNLETSAIAEAEQGHQDPKGDLDDEEEAALMLFSLSQAQPQVSKRSASHKDLIKLQEVRAAGPLGRRTRCHRWPVRRIALRIRPSLNFMSPSLPCRPHR